MIFISLKNKKFSVLNIVQLLKKIKNLKKNIKGKNPKKKKKNIKVKNLKKNGKTKNG